MKIFRIIVILCLFISFPISGNVGAGNTLCDCKAFVEYAYSLGTKSFGFDRVANKTSLIHLYDAVMDSCGNIK